MSDKDAAAEQPKPDSDRVFLVVVDDSDEMRLALRFAALSAKRAGGRVALMFVQDSVDFQHWLGVEAIMREEAREKAEEILQKLSADVFQWSGSYPVLYIREGDRRDELLALLNEEPSIKIVVLAASTGSGGPGPIISYLVGKGVSQLHVPVMIVPGSLTEEEVVALT
ncbi:MAG: universal stress protein [Alphaproteobacteria bacterium]